MADEFLAPLIAELSLRTIVSDFSLAVKRIATDPGKRTILVNGLRPSAAAKVTAAGDVVGPLVGGRWFS